MARLIDIRWTDYTDKQLAETILTPKELEVWKLVAAGYGKRRIARILNITESAARARKENARIKITRAKEAA